MVYSCNSYLSQREQFVGVNGHNSLSLPVYCGVPQGSILGPLYSYYKLMTCLIRLVC